MVSSMTASAASLPAGLAQRLPCVRFRGSGPPRNSVHRDNCAPKHDVVLDGSRVAILRSLLTSSAAFPARSPSSNPPIDILPKASGDKGINMAQLRHPCLANVPSPCSCFPVPISLPPNNPSSRHLCATVLSSTHPYVSVTTPLSSCLPVFTS